MNTQLIQRLLVCALLALLLGSAGLAAPVWAAAPTGAAEGGHAEGGGNLFSGDLGNMIWTLVVFVLLLVVLGKYAWGPILSGLQERERFIRDSLTQAKTDREAALAQLKAYEERLTQARTEATKIVEEGRKDAEAVKAKVEEQAKLEADRMIERAKREIEIAKDTAIKDLYAKAGQLATDAASRIIRQELKPQDHQRLVADAIARLESSPPGSYAGN